MRALSMLVVAAACSCAGSRIPPPPVALVSAVPQASASAARPPRAEGWLATAIDRNVPSGAGIALDDVGPVVAYAPAGPVHTVLLRSGKAGWIPSLGAKHADSRMTFANDGHGKIAASMLTVEGMRALVLSGETTTPETVAPAQDLGALAFDRDSGLHACFVGASSAGSAVSYAARGASGSWSIAPIGRAERGSCALAVDGAGVPHVAYVSPGRGLVVATRGPAKEWTESVLHAAGKAPRVLVAPDGTAAVVYLARDAVTLARRAQGHWVNETLARPVPDALSVTGAFDRSGQPHVLVSAGRGDAFTLRSLAAARDGIAEGTVWIGHKAPSAPSIVIDPATGTPHVAFVGDESTVFYATTTPPGSTTDAKMRVDAASIAAGCHAHIRAMIAEENRTDIAAAQKRWRDCAWLRRPDGPAREDVSALCAGGSAAGCVALGAMVAPHAEDARPAHGLRVASCAGEVCSSRVSKVVDLGSMGGGVKAAGDAVARACELGEGVACVLRGNVAADAKDLNDALRWYLRACEVDVAAGCTSALNLHVQKQGSFSDGNLTTMRGRLERACKSVESGDACNALAFMQERALGGAKAEKEALASSLRACGLGSGMSCARLLLGPGARPAPPKMSAERLVEALRDTCTNDFDGSACLALASAYETGWGVPQDYARARQTLNDGCDHHKIEPCRKLGRKLP